MSVGAVLACGRPSHAPCLFKLQRTPVLLAFFTWAPVYGGCPHAYSPRRAANHLSLEGNHLHYPCPVAVEWGRSTVAPDC